MHKKYVYSSLVCAGVNFCQCTEAVFASRNVPSHFCHDGNQRRPDLTALHVRMFQDCEPWAGRP